MLEDHLRRAMEGVDASMLQEAIDRARNLSVLPTDPNCGSGARAVVPAPGALKESILKASSAKEAVPKAWQEALHDAKQRIRPSLLDEARELVAIDKQLLAKAGQRVIVLRAESELRSATDGNDLFTLLGAISKCEIIEGVSAELLASSRTSAVKKAEALLESRCATGQISQIQEGLTWVGGIKGISEAALSNAKQKMTMLAQDAVSSAMAGDSPDGIRAAIAEAEAIEGVDPDLLASADKRIQELEKKKCCTVM